MNKRILQLAVPSIISNITVPLLGLVDVAIVGHIGDAAYIGAIAVGSMLFNVIYWLFGFLRMGTSGMTSQALGRRDLAEVLRLLVRSLSIGVGDRCAVLRSPEMADRLRTLGDVAGSGCRGTGTEILLCLYLGSPGSAWTLRIYGLVYRYAEHAHSDDGISDTECG